LQLLRPPIRTLPRQPAAAESLGVKDRSVPSPPATRDDPQESPIAINGRKGRAGKAAVRQPRACGHDKFPSLGREPVQLGWYEWIARRHPGGRFVDVGAGVGAGLAYLTYLGARSVQGFDVDPRLRDYPRIAIGRSALEALGPRCCDVAVCIDVIEHVVEDGPFFQELRQLAMRALYVTTPNYNRSRAASAFHAREYTIAEFVNRFQPDELWVASPDGWYHRTQLLIRESDCYRRCSTGDIWPVGHVPTDFYFHDNSPDGLEWAHFCGVFQTECVAS
jgi:2-polyprenyl-3-methyl-5-hydroxy-6-metoxy-1,4-benzoquinol methylase